MRKPQSGFTLIEIAIVLVIIGLLLGGVLKGQELITAARVRNLVSNQDGVKAAYFGFLDRYRGLPGDYKTATTTIPGCVAATCPDGDGNGKIDTANESIAAWSHLSKAGFITGSYNFAAGAVDSTTTPSNPYGTYLQLIFDDVYQGGTGLPRHNLKTGHSIPSDILAEVDRKIDDGLAATGQFRHSTYNSANNTLANCAETSTGNPWKSQSPYADCGGVTLF